MKRLNLGAGNTPLEGYENRDAKTGDTIYPLPEPDNTVDEIRASHVLEHFGHREVPAVLADWVRALKDGGKLRIAVPNFEDIARRYLNCEPLPVEGFIMGGQSDDLDYHKSIFDAESLTVAMRRAGLRDIVKWESEVKDCASYPISLNLQGTKRRALTPADVKEMNIGAAMSVPRLGFMDNYFCAFQSLGPLGIQLRKFTGAFWGQCLERTMEAWVDEGKDWILTVDYDSVWTPGALQELLEVARDSDADAIAPIQVHRTQQRPLMTMKGEDGKNVTGAPRSAFQGSLTRINNAHFGLTMIRVSALKDIPKPWFAGQPQDDGTWGPYRTDDDVWFWRQWEKHGRSLYLANRVVIGHAELMIRWPDENFKAVYQHPNDFYADNGPPEGTWT